MRPSLRLWLAWVLASGIGGMVFARVARSVSLGAGGVVGDAAGPVAAEAVIGALVLGGIMLGIAAGQWLVIRRRVPWAGAWALSMVAGGTLGGALGLGVHASLATVAGEAARVAAAVVVGLAAYGSVQWLVLRRRVSRAGRYAATSTAALVAAVVGSTLLGVLFGDFSGSGLGGGIWGAVYGAVTGRGLIAAAARPA